MLALLGDRICGLTGGRSEEPSLGADEDRPAIIDRPIQRERDTYDISSDGVTAFETRKALGDISPVGIKALWPGVY